MTRNLLRLVVLLCALTTPALAQKSDFTPFWSEFAAAAKAGDKAKVRALTKFPFLHFSDLREEKHFDAIWKDLFDAKARACLAKAKPKYDKTAKPPNYDAFCQDTIYIFEHTPQGWRFASTHPND